MGTDYYAAIPWSYIDLLHTGDATGCMLCTYVILHRLADWGTGRVERVSAQGLSTWSEGAFNPDTFSRALLRMERQNHITREITPGSHKSYPVIIHNYEASIREPERGEDGKLVKDSDGRVVFTARKETINLKEWRTWAETKEILGEVPMRDPMIKRGSKKAYDQAQGSTSRGRSEEGTDDGTDEGTDEATERTSSIRPVCPAVASSENEAATTAAAGPAAVAAAVTPTRPPIRLPIQKGTASPKATALSNRLWIALGRPEPAGAARKLDSLRASCEGLPEALDWILQSKDKKHAKWRTNLLKSKDPLAYLGFILSCDDFPWGAVGERCEPEPPAPGPEPERPPPQPAAPPSGGEAAEREWTAEELREHAERNLGRALSENPNGIIFCGPAKPEYAAAMASVYSQAPANIFFDKAWQPWMPGLSASRFVTESEFDAMGEK